MEKENLDEKILEPSANELNPKEIQKEVKSQKRKKSGKRFLKICSIVVDILIIPVIILAFACTILTFSAKANNQVPSIFGMSIVTVVSNSMEPDYMVGDVLVIKKTNLNNLEIGDNIAFYAPLTSQWTITDSKGEKHSKVIFHQIVRIAEIEGKRYFVCMGTNINYTPEYIKVDAGKGDYKLENGEYKIDKNGDYVLKLEEIANQQSPTTSEVDKAKMGFMQYISDEYVVGIYDGAMSPAIGGFIKFCSSTQGMIALVIAPSVVLILLTIAGLSKEVKEAKEEDEKDKLVLEGNLSKLKETSNKEKEKHINNNENIKTEEEKKDEELDVSKVISSVTAKKQTPSTETLNSVKTKSALKQPNFENTQTTNKTEIKEDIKPTSKSSKLKANTSTTQSTAPTKRVDDKINSATKTTTSKVEEKPKPEPIKKVVTVKTISKPTVAENKIVPKKAPVKKPTENK